MTDNATSAGSGLSEDEQKDLVVGKFVHELDVYAANVSRGAELREKLQRVEHVAAAASAVAAAAGGWAEPSKCPKLHHDGLVWSIDQRSKLRENLLLLKNVKLTKSKVC